MNLSNLPSDVIRKIIRVGQGSIDNMKMISPRWKSLADEHLSNRNNLPTMKCLRLHVGIYYHRLMYIETSAKYGDYFGVDHWKEDLEVEDEWAIEQDPESTIKVESEYKNVNGSSKLLNRIVERCKSIDLLKIELGIYPSQNDADTIKRALHTVPIKDLQFTVTLYDDEFAGYVRDIIQDLHVQRIILRDEDGRFLKDETLRPFLTELLRHAPVVDITCVDKYYAVYDKEKIIPYWKGMANDRIDNGQLKTTVNIEPLKRNKGLVTISVKAKDAQ